MPRERFPVTWSLIALSEFGTNPEYTELGEKAFYHVDNAVVAPGIWRTQKKAGVRNKRERVMNNAFGDFGVLELDLDPESFDLWVALEEFNFYVICTTFELMYKKERLGALQVYDLAPTRLKVDRHLLRKISAD